MAPRKAALEILRAVRRGETFEAALGLALGDMPEADRRLAHEIAAGALRSRAELDAQLVPRVTSDWNGVAEDTRDLLRVGAYQLLHLSRVPAHAAVAATVELAKRERGARLAGFVNAVLRRLAREHESAAGGGVEPAAGTGLSIGELARRFSHPEWLTGRWVQRFGAPRTADLLAHNNRIPAVFLQPARWDAAALRRALQEAGVAFTDAPDGAGVGIRGVRIDQLPGFREGGFVVQDPGQAIGLAHVGVRDGAHVWDACAAPGGKTATLARRCHVVASDLRRDRMGRLLETARRAAPGARVLCADARRPPFAAGQFDAVVLDAPCSATGTFAKHPDARWRVSARRLERLRLLQAELLDGVAPVVRPGGLLAYLTCSLEPEENEAQVDAFLERHPEFARAGTDLFLFPPDRGTDGGYAAALTRAA